MIQKKEQKMRRKNWCVQRVDEEVAHVGAERFDLSGDISN